MATTPEPGWYDDGTGKQRWWDGSRWTEHYVDLAESDLELHVDLMPPPTAPTAPGWYDDGRGRQRWWDGMRWTDAAQFSEDAQSCAGIVVDGRWIHFGDLSQPVADAKAALHTGAELLKRGRLAKPAIARTLFGASGLITPNGLKRAVVAEWSYLLIEVAGQTWLAPVPGAQEADAPRFVTWVGTVSEHYRYR